MSSLPTSQHPNAIAREAIGRLAAERLPATPANFARVYGEIAGTAAKDSVTQIPDAVRAAISQLPEALASRTLTAAGNGDWATVADSLAQAGRGAGGLHQTMSRMLAQLETHHAGITLTKKREGLKRALLPRDEPIDRLQDRLQRLMDSWAGPADDARADLSQNSPSAVSDANVPILPAAALPGSSAGSSLVPSVAASIASAITRSRHAPLVVDQEALTRLCSLFELLLQNIAELTPEAALLQPQVDQIGRVLSPPLTEHKLDEAERTLRQLIIRQGTLRHGLDEAKVAVKAMVGSLIDRLASVSAQAGTYSGKVEALGRQIEHAENLTQLSLLVKDLVADTQLMAADMLRARDDLTEARQQALRAEERSRHLEEELAKTSALVRTDPLTQALNRRGFDEAYAAERSRAQRGQEPLSLALLDVDDFKRINDVFGHAAGDQALCHLSDVLRQATRPTDAVARYGGEEFALLFPGTAIEKAANSMTRMQRELTKRLFLQDDQRILITFSCGVTSVHPNESMEVALLRADQALGEAKSTGKNRVVVKLPTSHST